MRRPRKKSRDGETCDSKPAAGAQHELFFLRIETLQPTFPFDVQRVIGAPGNGKSISVQRIYDRIAWFDEVFLAYEREMLRRWRKKVEKDGSPLEHRRTKLKTMPFDPDKLSPEIREELAPWVYKATLQPASTFMNSIRERLSAAARAGSGGARVGGTYIQGAIFNPKVLIQLLNIFRVHYNFFELRPYACPYEEIDDLVDPPKLTARKLKYPGTDEVIELPPRVRKKRATRTPAMRHGMDAFTRRKDGIEDAPDIYRVLYRPWLLAGTKFAARLDSSRKKRSSSANETKSQRQSDEGSDRSMPDERNDSGVSVKASGP